MSSKRDNLKTRPKIDLKILDILTNKQILSSRLVLEFTVYQSQSQGRSSWFNAHLLTMGQILGHISCLLFPLIFSLSRSVFSTQTGRAALCWAPASSRAWTLAARTTRTTATVASAQSCCRPADRRTCRRWPSCCRNSWRPSTRRSSEGGGRERLGLIQQQR